MLTVAVVSLMAAPSVAPAKGPVEGFVFDGYLIPGQRVSDRELLRVFRGPSRGAWEFSPLLVRRAPYFAFVENRDDAWINFGWPSPRLAKPIPIGRVDLRAFRHRGERRVEARLSFRVPDLTPGLYDVIICDMGCDRTVKRLEPPGLYVVSGRVERRLRNEIDNLYAELSRWENRIVRLSGRVSRGLSEERWRFLKGNLTTLEDEVDALRRQVAENNRTTGSFAAGTPVVAGAIVAAIAGLCLGRLKRRGGR